MSEIGDLEKLKDDKNYYGEFGKKWLSNSDIYSLLNDPLSFRVAKEQTKAMIEGRYFHTALLEPHKIKNYKVVDMSSRNTKAYKDLLEDHGEIMLLKKEQSNLDQMVSVIKNNKEMIKQIYDMDNQYEIPGVKEIMGVMWKGKADIICEDKIIDIKSSADISRFKWSASKYNYDSQAYIYQKLFGKPVEFFVIDKTTHQLAIFTPSLDFLERGQEKVGQAVEIYNTFFTPESTEDINQYVHYETL